jgi:NRPS condensation-like uncharacterized protein
MLRKLGTLEKAMLISNKHAPFNIVSVLNIENAPSPDAVRGALIILQKRHPLLRARIVEGENNPYFEALPVTDFSFKTLERTNSESWRDAAEGEMAASHDSAAGPLFRAVYLYRDGFGDLVLSVHHAIMDAVSGVNLLDELLRLCAGEVTNFPALEVPPAMEERFPFPYRGPWRGISTLKYALSQMVDTLRYQWRNRGKRMPPVRSGGRGYTATLILPEHLVDSLSHQGRQAGLTLNSLLNTALMLATDRHLYGGKPATMRTFTFADLRPFTEPPTPPENLANYMTLLGITLDVSGKQDFWALANELQAKIYHTLKSGDKFSAVLMSEMLLKMITRTKFMRFGATALSYSGVVSLKKQYENIKVTGLHGFVSGYDLGPEMASQTRLFNDQVWWDFIYLDTDMDTEMAEKIIGEVKTILESASQKSD